MRQGKNKKDYFNDEIIEQNEIDQNHDEFNDQSEYTCPLCRYYLNHQ